MKLTLKILLNGETIQEISWGPGVFRIGRSDFCDLVLSNENISRSQLEIRVTENSVYVTNMAASGRLKINGEIVETGEIQEGDIIAVGPYEFLSLFEDSKPNVPLGIPPSESAPSPEWEAPVAASAPENPPKFQDFQNEPRSQVKESLRFPTEGTSALRSETLIEPKPIIAKLIFTAGPKQGTELFLDAFEVTLGRSRKADIYLDDEKLSRIHAKITKIGLGYRLIDLSSRHGTFVNGVRILEHPLGSFDVIELGHSKAQFLIHDMASALKSRERPAAILPFAETKSLQLAVPPPDLGRPIELARPTSDGTSPLTPPSPRSQREEPVKPRRPVLLSTLAILCLVLLWWLMKPESPPSVPEKPAVEINPAPEIKLPPNIPREFTELTPENQRAVEGYYNSALTAAEKTNWEDALWNLKKLRELISYYKQSIELTQSYTRRLKEKLLQETQKKAAQSEQADLARYLQEGKEYLKEGNFDLAADAFNQAITIDPTSNLAKRGLRAAEYKVKSVDELPPERDPEKEMRKMVADLFQIALTAFQSKSYQEAIDAGERIRRIELKGDTKYLGEAKVIIDRARLLQKEEFEPFLIQAKEKFAEGDYTASRDLCEEMLKRDPAYEEANECAVKAKRQLNRLAKENYTTGYVLESMNRIEEAKQYWNRAKNFVRPGDPYYDKVIKKLDEYQ